MRSGNRSRYRNHKLSIPIGKQKSTLERWGSFFPKCHWDDFTVNLLWDGRGYSSLFIFGVTFNVSNGILLCQKITGAITIGLFYNAYVMIGIGFFTIFFIISCLMIYYWIVVKRAYTEKGIYAIHSNDYELTQNWKMFDKNIFIKKLILRIPALRYAKLRW